jgi:predicted ATPase
MELRVRGKVDEKEYAQIFEISQLDIRMLNNPRQHAKETVKHIVANVERKMLEEIDRYFDKQEETPAMIFNKSLADCRRRD